MNEEPRIEVTDDGPYRVYGRVPLKVLAPVHTFNGEPVDWHALDDIPNSRSRFDLCRCGRSENKPFCDKTHELDGFDGAETADKIPYLDRAKQWTHGDQVLADDLALCVDAGFCGTRTTKVWQLFEKTDNPTQREEMRQMVFRCPSGRIALVRDGAPDEPALPQEIAIIPGGPIWARGGIPVVGTDGVEWERRNRVTLCRCGESKNKPFCDFSHRDAHFDER